MNYNGISYGGIRLRVKKYVTDVFERQVALEYHNIDHVESVVKWTFQLSQMEKIPVDKLYLLIIAAWFHDTGYSITYEQHEQSSITIMEKFLKNDLEPCEIEFISDCISATHPSQKPEDIYQSIICDADLAHLGMDDYNVQHQRLRNEWKEVLGKEYSDNEWCQLNFEFLKKHKYYTSSANYLFNSNKKINALNLKAHIKSKIITT